MKHFKKINPEEITENTFKTISKDWLLLTDEHKHKLKKKNAN